MAVKGSCLRSHPIYRGEAPRNGNPMHLFVLLQAGLVLSVPGQ
jgi:hypothetical protein